MTIAEREELKAKVEEMTRNNLREASALFPQAVNWENSAMERERLAAREQAIIQDGGHIATEAELEQFQSNAVPVTAKMTKLVVSLLRSKKAGKSASDIPHRFEMDSEGWVRCRDIINAVRDEIVGSTFNLGRLIALVKADEYLRMQMCIEEPRQGQVIEERSFVSVRAVSAHDESCHIDHRKLYSEKTKFQYGSTPDLYRGPDYVFYFTDLAGLLTIWRENAITPTACCFGIRNMAFVFCSLVEIDNPACPEACKTQQSKFKYKITLDFRMMTWDKLSRRTHRCKNRCDRSSIHLPNHFT